MKQKNQKINFSDDLLKSLEFDQILVKIADFTNIENNKITIKNTKPLTTFKQIERKHQLVNDAINIANKKTKISFIETGIIKNDVSHASKQKMLSSLEIFQIAEFIKFHEKIAKIIHQAKYISPSINSLLNKSVNLKNLTKKIDQYLDSKGQIKPDATNALKFLNKQLDNIGHEIKDKLEIIITNNLKNNVIQENIITLRNDRFCLSIKANEKNAIPGIIHSTSDSGQTVFLEPIQTINLGNERQEVYLEIKKELDKILKMLVNDIGVESQSINTKIKEHNKLDEIFAIAFYTLKCNYTEFITHNIENTLIEEENYSLKLIDACHPLIDKVIPLNLDIISPINAIAITGPNTGGKTVALKTTGLLTIMALSGIPIPARKGTKIPLYNAIFCDIGDEQSIEQSLSTFSAHIKSIIKAINYGNNNSLILLDELGAGTDPDEGARLAVAILDYLVNYKAHIIISTHHSEVKKYVANSQTILNASMEFNLKKLVPTFKINIGVPGNSNALLIAKKIGLSNKIIKKARSLISKEEIVYAKATKQLSNQLRMIDSQKTQIVQLKLKLKKTISILQNDFNKINKTYEKNHLNKLNLVNNHLKKIEASIAKLQIDQDKKQLDMLQNKFNQQKKLLSSIEQEITDQHSDNFSLGDEVYIKSIKTYGKIKNIHSSNNIEIETDQSRIIVKIDDIKLSRRNIKLAMNKKQNTFNISPVSDPGNEIEIRGKPIDIAIEQAEKFIDHAARFGHRRAMIIHGKGSGKLKKTIREILDKHPLIEKYENASFSEGGAGVTIIYLEHIN
ncbi:MAG: Smr/MutS family protein [Dehalococcoidia bacterium]|nr:Smr/MutS family protein [Dehalococcoidia bacterium]